LIWIRSAFQLFEDQLAMLLEYAEAFFYSSLTLRPSARGCR